MIWRGAAVLATLAGANQRGCLRVHRNQRTSAGTSYRKNPRVLIDGMAKIDTGAFPELVDSLLDAGERLKE
jgi:hypothetical protein